MINTRIMIITAFAALLTSFGASANHIPSNSGGWFGFEGRSTLLLDLGRFDPLVELEGRLEDAGLELGYRSLTAGTYLRLHKNLKAGLFYRVQQGARHDDDWIEPALDEWEWVDSGGRTEQVLILDVTPRFLLEALPGGNWILAIKNRYQYNTFNGHHSLMVRPGITYFLMRSREPLLNVSLNYGLYIPLNFGETLLYEHEPYVSVLYHLNRSVKLELTGAYKTVVWSSSEDSLANGDTYAVRNRSLVVGFALLFPVSF